MPIIRVSPQLSKIWIFSRAAPWLPIPMPQQPPTINISNSSLISNNHKHNTNSNRGNSRKTSSRPQVPSDIVSFSSFSKNSKMKNTFRGFGTCFSEKFPFFPFFFGKKHVSRSWNMFQLVVTGASSSPICVPFFLQFNWRIEWSNRQIVVQIGPRSIPIFCFSAPSPCSVISRPWLSASHICTNCLRFSIRRERVWIDRAVNRYLHSFMVRNDAKSERNGEKRTEATDGILTALIVGIDTFWSESHFHPNRRERETQRSVNDRVSEREAFWEGFLGKCVIKAGIEF